MVSLTRVLVPTDFSTCADRALLHALELYREFGAELHLLHVIAAPDGNTETEGIPGKDAYYRHLEASAIEKLAHLVGTAGTEPFLRIRHTTRRDIAAAPAILDYAEAHDVDLIVKGTHGRQGGERFRIGSTAEKVARFARCTVLTVGPQGGRVAALAQRILVPIDFSKVARRALGYAKVLAAHYEARLFLLHVIAPELRPVFYEEHPEVLTLNVPRLEERAYAELGQFLKRTRGPSVQATGHVVRGRPAQAIASFAKHEDCHLIVQGSRGLAGTAYLLLGSVAEEVIRSAPCPVFTVRKHARTPRRGPVPAAATSTIPERAQP